MEENLKTLGDYLAVLRRRKWQALSVTLLIIPISVLVALGLPPVYRSTATILIEQQEMPQELVRSTITTFAAQRIQLIRQRVMTSANLLEIMRKYNLYPKAREKQATEGILARMEEDINMEMVSVKVLDPQSGREIEAAIAFTVSYDSNSPELAQRVANELTSLYLNENLRSRTQLAAETSVFLTKEVEQISTLISELEAKLAEFKERNAGKLPEMTELNVQLMDRTEKELAEVERQIRTLQERKIYLDSELAQLDPTKSYAETDERLMGPKDRLKLLQNQYLSMSAVYAPAHPDVITLQKEIEALKKQTNATADAKTLAVELSVLRQQLAVAQQRYSKDHPDVKRLVQTVANVEEELNRAKNVAPETPDNPAYVLLRAQLEAANTEIRSLHAKRQELSDRLASFEERLTQAPQVEREYRMLTRDYENALTEYQEIKAKQMDAKLAEQLEVERKGERLTLIEPPRLPEEPIKPNRRLILFLGVVFSFAGGIGSAALAESLDTTIRGTKGVAKLLGAPPLAIIPYIETKADRLRKLLQRTLATAALVGSIAVAAVLIHRLVVPLDVVWLIGLQRLGL